jgi:DNA modification methylase
VSESFLNGKITLHRGDCLEVLPLLEANSIDSCVTDPPYHLTSIVKRFGQPNSAPAHQDWIVIMWAKDYLDLELRAHAPAIYDEPSAA